MRIQTISRLAILSPVALALAACGGGSDAGYDDSAETGGDENLAPNAIQVRQDNFERMSDAFKTLREELDKEAPSVTVLGNEARAINTGTLALHTYFPEGSGRDDGWDTEALATIWEKPEEFQSAIELVRAESEKMVSLASFGDVEAVRGQVGPLGMSCKNCHDTFRLDTD